jgi:putrescine transport system ATP-binding protein
VPGTVASIGYLGDFSIYKLRLGGGFFVKAARANTTRLVEGAIGVGDRVWLTWASDAGVVLTT